jgi:YD repeat-containing protein
VTAYTATRDGIPSTVPYTYDADSNRLSEGSTTFAYNGADQLVSQTKNGVQRTATYDAAGNLLSSPVSDTTNSTFTYDTANKPLTEAVPGQPR